MTPRARVATGWRGAVAALIVLALLPGCGSRQAEDAGSRGPATGSVAEFWVAFRAASQARRQGDIEAAVHEYVRALEIDPRHADSLYYLGQLRYGRGEVAAAHDLFDQLSRIEPRGLRAWQQLGVVRGQPAAGWRIDLEGARAASRRAIDLNRDESRSYLLLARWEAYAGHSTAADDLLDEALGRNPNLEEAHQLRRWLRSLGGVSTNDAASALQPVDLDTWRRAAGPVTPVIRGHLGALSREASAWPLRVELDVDDDGLVDRLEGNVHVESEVGRDRIGARLLIAAAGGFRDSGWRIRGPIVAAAAADVDGDGDADLVTAGSPLALGATHLAEAAGDSVLSWWRNDQSRFVKGHDIFPPLSAQVLDLAVLDLDGDGRTDLYVATGGLWPESEPQDRLFLGSDGGFVDATQRLGRRARGASRRLAIDGDGRLLVLRGGQVPAEPSRVLRLNFHR